MRTDLLFLIDSDDPTKDSYPDNSLVLDPPGRCLSEILNRHITAWVPLYNIIGFVGDDNRFKKYGWEYDLLASYGGIMYGNDGVQGEKLCTTWFVNTDIIKALGWFALPECNHFFTDNAWMEIGRATGELTYLPNFDIEHLHYSFGKSQKDETYERSERVGSGDDIRFANWRNSPRFQEAVDKVMNR